MEFLIINYFADERNGSAVGNETDKSSICPEFDHWRTVIQKVYMFVDCLHNYALQQSRYTNSITVFFTIIQTQVIN